MKTATMAVRREACGVDLGALQLSNPVETVCSESAPWHTRPLLTSLLLCGNFAGLIRERAVVYPNRIGDAGPHSSCRTQNENVQRHQLK
jgi:hypothetical protein